MQEKSINSDKTGKSFYFFKIIYKISLNSGVVYG